MIEWKKYMKYEDGKLFWNDLSEFDEISNLTKGKCKIGKRCGSLYLNKDRKTGYRKIGITINGKFYYYKEHRIVWEMFNGEIPKGLQIDHINGDGSDNRIENLRLSTPSQNSTNRVRKCKKTSNFRNVWYRGDRNKWVSSFVYGGKNYWVGTFETEQEAYLEYERFARKVVGEFFKEL